MASGSFEFAYAYSAAGSGLQGKIVWSSTSNGSAANTSSVTAILYARRNNNATTSGQSWSGWVHVNGVGVNVSLASSTSVSSDWVEMARTTQTITHNANGTKQVGIDGSITGPTSTKLQGVTSSGNQIVTLDTIPRNATITNFSVTGRTSTTITLNCTTDVACSKVEIFLNGWDWVDGSLPNTTIGNLIPNTQYSFKARVKRTDSQQWTESNTIYGTTYQATLPTISLSSKTSTSITVTSSCNVTAMETKYRIKQNGGSYGSYQDSATFNNLSPNTVYIVEVRKKATDSGEYGYATVSVTTYQATLPTIRLVKKLIGRIDVTSSCNVAIKSTLYRIKKKDGGTYGALTSNTTFTGLAPNTEYTIEVQCVGKESNETGTDTIDVTTYDYARITSASNINFGDTIEFSMTNPSGEKTELTIYYKNPQNQLTPIVRRSYIPNQYNLQLYDSEWDSFYRKMGTLLGNTIPIRYELKTTSNNVIYSVYVDKTLTITGNQKTAHVGINGVQKRAKVYIGVGGNVKRAIVWVKIGGKMRCI